MKFLTALLFLFAVPYAMAQNTPYSYSVPDVSNGEAIFCIRQDANGRLLVGTEKGVFAYTGFRSTRIPLVGSISNEITVLEVYGSVVFAANRVGQFFQLQGGKFIPVQLPEFVGDIRQIHFVNNEVQIVGSKFISWYSYPRFQFLEDYQIPYTEPQGAVANWVTSFKDRQYAVLNSGELVEIDDASSRSLLRSTGKFVAGFNGRLAVIPSVVANEPVFSYLNGGFTNWGPLIQRGSARVNTGKVIGNQLFVLTENGMFVYTNALTRRPSHWFPGTNVTAMTADSKGNLWIGTRGKGMLFVPAGRHDIVYSGSLIDIKAGPENTFFGGMQDGSIARFDLKGNIVQRFENPSVSLEPQFLHYDAYANVLFSNTGVFSLKTGKPLGPDGENVKAVARDKKGGIFLAKSTGIVYIPRQSRKIQYYGLTDSSQVYVWRKEPARSVVINPETGEVAMSTVRGVFKIDNRQQLIEISDNGQSIDAQHIIWQNGSLLIFTTENELLTVDGTAITHRTSLASKIGDVIILKVLFHEDYLYFLTERGMFRMKNPGAPLENLKELIGFDGLVIRDFTALGKYIYVASQRGVMRFVWRPQKKAEFSFMLGEIRGRIHPVPDTGKNGVAVFPADEEMIIVPFECIDLTHAEPFLVQYSVYEAGEKRVWNELPSSSQQISLTHLGQGEYNIDFRLIDPVTGETTPIQSKKFVLHGTWYARQWFIWSLILVIAGTVGYTWRWTILRERRKHRGSQPS